LTVLLDIKAESAADRLQRRYHRPQQEAESADFLGSVRSTYLELAKRCDTPIATLDADRPVEFVHHEIRALVEPLIAALRPPV
jgi:thymidylate kinase